MDIGRIPGLTDHSAIYGKEKNDGLEQRLQAAMGKRDKEALKKACSEFEGIFLSILYKQMKATVPQSGLFPGSAGKDIFESMLDEKLMEKASQNRGIGLGDVLYRQISSRWDSMYRLTGEGE